MRMKHLLAHAEFVKKDLDELDFKVLHHDKRGLNVIVKPMVDAEHDDIIKYCEDNDYDFVTCPNYIRIDEDAISIELKRLSFDSKGKRIKSK